VNNQQPRQPNKPKLEYLSLEERDLLGNALFSDAYPTIVKFLEKEIDNMGKELILCTLEPTQEGVLKVAYIKAKLDGASLLLSRFKNLKAQLRA
jgi:hypothetical protein